MQEKPTQNSSDQDRPSAGGIDKINDFFRRLLPPRKLPTARQLTVALLILGTVWRIFHYALAMPIWGDEAFVAINFIERGFGEMIEPLVYGQIVPLLYMWAVEAVSRVGGYSEYSLRLVALLSGLAALPLFWRFARTIMPQRAAIVALAFLACAYFPTRHSAEVKPYASDLLVALLLMMAGWAVYTHPRSVWRWTGLLVLAAVSPWASYPSLFVSGSVGLLLTVLLTHKKLCPVIVVGWAAFGFVLSASAAAMYMAYAQPHAEAASRLTEINLWARTFPPIAHPWKLPLWFVAMHTGNMFAYPQGGSAPGSIATFALFVVGCVRLWRHNRPLLVLMLGPFVMTFFAAAFEYYPYGGAARIAQYVAPAICLTAGLGTYTILHYLYKGCDLQRAVLLLVAFFAIIPVVTSIDNIRKPYATRLAWLSNRAVREMAEKTRPDDRWIVFNADKEGDPDGPWLGDWRGVGGQWIFDMLRFAPVTMTWAPDPESIEPQNKGRTWLIAYKAIHPKTEWPQEQYNDYVQTLSEKLGKPVEHKEYVVKDREEQDKYEAVVYYLFNQ